MPWQRQQYCHRVLFGLAGENEQVKDFIARFRADLLLLLVAISWGSTYLVVKELIIRAPGFALKTLGVAHTSATNTGLIISRSMVFLAGNGSFQAPGIGDYLVLGAALARAVYVVLMHQLSSAKASRFTAPDYPSIGHLCAVVYGGNAGPRQIDSAFRCSIRNRGGPADRVFAARLHSVRVLRSNLGRQENLALARQSAPWYRAALGGVRRSRQKSTGQTKCAPVPHTCAR